MNALKRLGAAFFAASMLSTINVANAKIFVGTNHFAESVNLIDKDLIESKNNELIAGKKKKKKKKKLNKQVVEASFKGQKITFLFRPNRRYLEVFANDKKICGFRDEEVVPPILQEKVFSCIRKKVSNNINIKDIARLLEKIF